MGEPKEWTLMFYFASDNPLAPGVVSQLKAIKDAGFHPDANVIARFDPHGKETPTHIFEVNLINKLTACGKSQVGPFPADPYVKNLVADKLWGDELGHFEDGTEKIKDRIGKAFNEDFGRIWGNGSAPAVTYNPPPLLHGMDKEQPPDVALDSFLQFCKTKYPANHYMLFIIGHGMVVGDDLFLYDENASLPRPQTSAVPAEHKKDGANGGTGPAEGDGQESPPQQSLSLRKLDSIVRCFTNQLKGRLELIGFHSCSMSALEVAYQLQGTARYMMASEGPAFIGSWPYRQILIRIFKDLNACLTADDLIDPGGFVAALSNEKDPVSAALRGCLSANTNELLKKHGGGPRPSPELLRHIIADLPKGPRLYQEECFNGRISEAVKRLRDVGVEDGDAARLTRLVLAEVYAGKIARTPQNHIEKLLKEVFFHCLYNSLDFQLAGYSFDLSLCDLSKVADIKQPLCRLTKALIEGLRGGLDGDDDDPLPQELILLAHWDAQSYWQENYVDLRDFCLRLQLRCRRVRDASKKTLGILKEIWEACEDVKNVLKKEVKIVEDPAREVYKAKYTGGPVVVRSEFAGPISQYSHGLSIYLPWSEPVGNKMWDKEYKEYRLNKEMEECEAKSSWKVFLKEYFDRTKRKPRITEDKDRKVRGRGRNKDEQLLEAITTIAFNEVGELNGPHSTKTGGGDPTGPSCDCASIKNHPSIIRARHKKDAQGTNGAEEGVAPKSRDFFEWIFKLE